MKYLIVLLLTFLSVSAFSQYALENATVTFEIKNAGITVDGSFDSVTLDMSMKKKKWETLNVSGKVYATTIKTGIGLRDKHLRNEDYFEVETYPWIRMQSTGFSEEPGGKLSGTFNLTIKDVTREITFPVNYNVDKNSLSLSGSFKLDRQEFGLGDDSLILSDEVEVFVEATFTLL